MSGIYSTRRKVMIQRRVMAILHQRKDRSYISAEKRRLYMLYIMNVMYTLVYYGWKFCRALAFHGWFEYITFYPCVHVAIHVMKSRTLCYIV